MPGLTVPKKFSETKESRQIAKEVERRVSEQTHRTPAPLPPPSTTQRDTK